MLGLQLQVVFFGLLEGLAHLKIELGVVHELPRSEHALLVREALEDKLELHRVLLELIVVVPLVSIVVPQRVESPRILAVEASHKLETAILLVVEANRLDIGLIRYGKRIFPLFPVGR